MDGLPEDQRDDDNESRSSSSQSSPEERPSSPEERPDSPPHHQGGAAALPPERAPAPRNDNLGAAVAPLLLRHASVSSLDESSQKYKSSVSTFSDTGDTIRLFSESQGFAYFLFTLITQPLYIFFKLGHNLIFSHLAVLACHQPVLDEFDQLLSTSS